MKMKAMIIIGTNKSNKIFSFAVNPSTKHESAPSEFPGLRINDKSNKDANGLNSILIGFLNNN